MMAARENQSQHQSSKTPKKAPINEESRFIHLTNDELQPFLDVTGCNTPDLISGANRPSATPEPWLVLRMHVIVLRGPS
jgi:hypothetical protein